MLSSPNIWPSNTVHEPLPEMTARNTQHAASPPLSSGLAISVPKVSAVTAERLWRQFTEEGHRHAEAAAGHQREAIRCFQSALAFREQMGRRDS